ncbi:MAG TPA: ABC transporter permease [Micromonosporaceae bacterium]
MSANEIGAVVRLNTTLFAREPGPIVSRICMPLVLLTVIRPLYTAALGSADGTAGAVAGMLVTFSLLGMSIVGSSILLERVWHTAERLRATPTRSLTVLAGKAIPVLGMLMLQQATILAYGCLVFGLHIASLPLLAATVVVWSSTLTALGALLGTLARSGGALSAMVDVGSLTVTGLGGAFVPLTLLPTWARAVAPISPGYWAMRTLRGALDGNAYQASTGWAALSGFAIVAASVAGRRLRRGWGRAGAA